MFIQNLKIKNFKNITDAELNFSSVNLIDGDTGNGKTAIVQAITYLLTDYLDDKIQEFVRRGAKKFELEMEFSHLEVNYLYKVEGSTSTKKELIVNGEETYYNSEATQYLGEQINPLLTRYSNISLQHDAVTLLFESSAKRLEKLKQLLNMEEINDVVIRAKDDYKKIKQEIEIKESELSILENQTFQYMELPQVINIDLDTKILEQKTLTDNVQSFTNEISAITNNLNLLQEKDIIAQEKLSRIAMLQMELGRGKDKEKEYLTNIEELKTEKDTFTSFRPIRDQSTVLADDLNKLKVEKDSLQQTLNGLSSGVCPTCNRPYEDVDINAIKQKKSDLQNKVVDIDMKIGDKELIYSNHKAQLKAYDKYKEKYDSVCNQLSFYEKEYNTFLEHLETVKNNVSSLNKEEIEKEILDTKNKVEEYDNKIQELHQTVSGLNQQVSQINIDINTYKLQKESYEKAEEFNNSVNKQETENTNSKIELRKVIEEKRAYNKTLKTFYTLINREFSSYLINSGAEFLKNKMNELFQKGYGKYQISFNNDGKGIEYYYTQDNMSFHSVKMLSGFEKEIFALSQRVALTYLNQVDIFIADEIESNASAQKSKDIFKTLLDESFLKQFIIITHIDSTKDFIETNYVSKVFEVIDGTIN